MFAPWRSQKPVRKRKDPITNNSFIRSKKGIFTKYFQRLYTSKQNSVFAYQKQVNSFLYSKHNQKTNWSQAEDTLLL